MLFELLHLLQKTNAQDDLKELERTIDALRTSGGIKQGALAKYMRTGDGSKFSGGVIFAVRRRV